MVKKGYHKTKSGKMAKKGLYYNINKKKRAGTSNSKKKSTISAKAYRNMKSGFKKQYLLYPGILSTKIGYYAKIFF